MQLLQSGIQLFLFKIIMKFASRTLTEFQSHDLVNIFNERLTAIHALRRRMIY